MFNLERSERAVIIFLVFTLLVGVGAIVYRKAHSSANFRVERFEGEGMPARQGVVKAKVNINQAGIGELMALKGVGKVLADRIVECRDTKGLFISVEDLKKVRGIGPALFEKIKDDIAIE